MHDWNEFSSKRILEVKQRVQTVVVYEMIEKVQDKATGEWYDTDPVQKEAIVDSLDRPIQASYT